MLVPQVAAPKGQLKQHFYSSNNANILLTEMLFFWLLLKLCITVTLLIFIS